MMSRYLPSLSTVLVVLSQQLACGSSVPPSNPNDPAGNGPKNPGRIEGTVIVQGQPSLADWPVKIEDSLGVSVDQGLVTNTQGHFISPNLSPGTYSLSVEVPVENLPVVVTGIEVAPGITTDLGILTSPAAPLTGRVAGQVVLDDETDASLQGTRVVLTRLSEGVTQVRDTETDAEGNYVFEELAAGDFEIRAQRESYTPAYATWRVSGTRQDSPPVLTLYPASAVIRISVSGPGGEVLGAPYTQARDVDLVMLAFGGVNEMRFSEMPDFVEAGGTVAWREYVAQSPITLSASEGRKTVYAQFRVMDPERGERLRTDTYQTSITYDVTAPVVIAFELAPEAPTINGTRYLAGQDPTSVPVRIVAFDPSSTVAGVKLIVEDADPATVPFSTISTREATATVFDTVALSTTDGAKTVGLQLVDGAGNVSSIVESSVVIDTLPPALLATDGIEVRDAPNDEITSAVVRLQFLVGDNPTTGADGPVRMRFGRFPLPATGPFISFLPEVTTVVAASHGEKVQFEGRFQDNAGNEITAFSREYTMNLLGSIGGTVLVEGEPDSGGDHTGTTVSVYEPGADPSTDPPVLRPTLGNSPATADTLVNGAYSITDIADGNYQVVITRPGGNTIVRAPIGVSAGRNTALGVDRITLARGGLFGVFLYGDLGPSASHRAITVIAKQNRGGTFVSVATTATDETGAYSFTGLPIGAYNIEASAEGYVTASSPATVEQNQILPVAPDSQTPPQPIPISLPKLSGDFKICDKDDTAPLPKDCGAVQYTSDAEVLLGLDADNVTHVRYVQQDPGATGVASFTNPTAIPTADLCASSPAPDCWNPYDPAERYLARVDGFGEGRVTLLVQFAANANLQDVGSATVVYDVTAPLNPSVTILHDGQAPVAGFTRFTELPLALTAVVTDTPGVEAAPIATVGVSRDGTLDVGSGGDREYPYGGGIKLFDVAAGDGDKDVYAWFCDAAGNCTTSPATDQVYLDQSAPDPSAYDLQPTGPGITLISLGARQWWARSTLYGVDIDVGTGPNSVPEVVAYQLALSADFVGTPWVYLDLGAVNPGDTVTVGGAALVPVDGEQLIYARFMDAAGNLSTTQVDTDKFSLFLDTIPPGGTVTLEGGVAYTRQTALTVDLTTDATDGAINIQYSWTGILPPPTAPKSAPTCNQTTSGCVYNPPYSLTPQVADGGGTLIDDTTDGRKNLVVRFFDAAGNFAERSASIFVDRTDPTLASASCSSCTVDPTGNLYASGATGLVTLSVFAADNSGVIDRVETVVDGEAPVGQAYSPYIGVVIPPDESAHTLTVTFFDPAGNSASAATITIQHDSGLPSSTDLTITGTIADGASSSSLTGTRDVLVTATATGADEMVISNSSGFSGAPWIPYDGSPLPWQLTAGDSPPSKTVWVKFRDWAGNTTDPVSASIVLDTTGPAAPTLTLDDGAQYTNAAFPHAVSARVVSSASGMRVGLLPDVADGTWQAVGTTSINVPSGDGAKRIFAQVRDAAGNVSVVVDASIVLDRTAPSLFVVQVGDGGPYVTEPSGIVDVLVDCADNLVTDVDLDLVISESTTELYNDAYQAVVAVDLGSEGLNRSLSVTCSDPAGNQTTGTSAIFDYDATPPSVSLELNNGVVRTRSLLVQVALTSDDAGTKGEMVALAEFPIPCATATYTYDGNATVTYALPPGDGTRTLYACARDAAGNVTATAQPSGNNVEIDTTGPAVPDLTRTSIDDASIQLGWTIPGDSDLVSFELERRLDGEGAFTSIATPTPPTAAFSDTGVSLGVRHFYRIRAFDDLGNASSYSIELSAGTPIRALQASYLNTIGDRSVVWNDPAGTSLIVGTYSYRDGSNALQEVAIPVNVTRYPLPAQSGLTRTNEKIILRNSNADGSLAWESTFLFGTLAQAIGPATINAVSLAIDGSGRPHIASQVNVVSLGYYIVDPTCWDAPNSCPFVVVDENGGAGNSQSLVLDALGVGHVAYGHVLNKELRYVDVDDACLSGGPSACVIHTLDTLASTPKTSIAIDSTGTRHIAYRNADGIWYVAVTDDCLANATCSPVEIESATGGGFFQPVAIRVDSMKLPRVVYEHATNGLRYVEIDSGCAAGDGCSPISLANHGQHVTMALDSRDTPHIALYNSNGGVGLEYLRADATCLTNGTGSCTLLNVDNGSLVGREVAIALDEHDMPRLCYLESDGSLMYLEIDAACLASPPSGCSPRQADARTNDRIPKIQVTGTGDPMIAYLEDTNDRVWLTKLDRIPSPVPIDQNTDVGEFNDLAVSPEGAAHMVYFDDTNDTVKYARTDVTGGAVTLDSVGSTGFINSSIDLDSSGVAHISYTDYNAGELRYLVVDSACLSNAPAACSPVTLAYSGPSATPPPNAFTAIAVDDADGIHVGYQDTTQPGPQRTDLYYMNVDANCLASPPANCVGRLIDDTAGDAGQFLKMATDGFGVPHMVYSRSVSGGAPYITYLEVDSACRAGGPADCDHQQLRRNDSFYDVYTAIAVDSRDIPHVAFFSTATASLRYVMISSCSVDSDCGPVGKCAPVAGRCVDVPLDAEGVPGRWVDLAVDSNDVAHVSYFTESIEALLYYRVDGASAPAIVDSVGNVSTFNAGGGIDVDAFDVPHLSYVRENGGTPELYYIRGPFVQPLPAAQVTRIQ